MGHSKKGFHEITRLNINYLPQEFTNQDLYKMFSSCGRIEFCQMVIDFETGIKSGMVNYSRSSSAKKAIRMFDKRTVEHRRIKVSYAISSRPKSDIQFEFRDGPKSRNDSECKVVESSAGKSDEVPSVEEIPVVNEAQDDTMKGGLCHMFQEHLNSSRGGSGGHWRDRIPSSLRIGSSNNRIDDCNVEMDEVAEIDDPKNVPSISKDKINSLGTFVMTSSALKRSLVIEGDEEESEKSSKYQKTLPRDSSFMSDCDDYSFHDSDSDSRTVDFDSRTIDSDSLKVDFDSRTIDSDSVKVDFDSRMIDFDCITITSSNSSSRKQSPLGETTIVDPQASTSAQNTINKYCYKYFMEVTRNEKNIGTISSSELLKRIKDKRREEGILEKDHVDDCEHPASGHRDNLDLEEGELSHSTSESDFSPLEIHIDLLADIRDFISTFYGGVSTVDIMARFEQRLPLSQPSICTDLLNEICDFRRNVYGEGMWYLKPEFRI